MSILNNICPLNIITKQVANAFFEDLENGIDYTASLVPNKLTTAKIITREHMILCGKEWVIESFKLYDPKVKIQWFFNDGDNINANETICIISGNSRSLLTVERTALNFLQTLSATATTTSIYVKKISHTNTIITDTRKTIPGLRLAQKYAVIVGGGYNQRFGLYDGVLIKENHINSYKSIANILNNAFYTIPKHIPIQIEVETFEQFNEAISNGAKFILLDNMSIQNIKKCIEINNNAILEASGGINLDNIIEYANTGVNRISIGNLTKNIQAIDLSMLFE
jgi:nicotinate-nucleotide pyrophosphorylase (carboxylating)